MSIFHTKQLIILSTLKKTKTFPVDDVKGCAKEGILHRFSASEVETTDVLLNWRMCRFSNIKWGFRYCTELRT
jgi:hypothetical protein